MTQPEVGLMVFQLRAAEYRATLSDAAFEQLASAKPGQDSALLSEVMYEIARDQQFALPSLAHLVRALAVEERLAEAALFCDRWLDLAPTCLDALVYRAVLACQAFDLAAAERSFRGLRDRGAADGVLWGINTMILLSFSDGSKSAETARAMLSAGWTSPWAVPLAAEAAFRTGDADLLVLLASSDPALLEETPQRKQQSLRLLRARVLGLLRRRGGTASP